MNKYISLIEFFENIRPQVRDIFCIYSALISCIEKGAVDRVMLDMEHIMYDRDRSKVRFRADRMLCREKLAYDSEIKKGNTDEKISNLMRTIRVCIKYADEQTIEYTDRLNNIYNTAGYKACANMLTDYRKRIKKSKKILCKGNFIFTMFIIIITVVYYRIYGIVFV